MPAAGHPALTALYDPVLALTMRERVWRARLLEELGRGLRRGGVVVDAGCGTGTLAIALSAERPDLRVIGVDGDPHVLRRAAAKDRGRRVDWREGLAQALPVEAGSADAVVMSLLLHHLMPPLKTEALQEARRVLAPGGRLVVADWGRPRGALPRIGFALLRLLDGIEGTRDHAAGRLPLLIERAGFGRPLLVGRLRTAWGTLELLRARRPA